MTRTDLEGAKKSLCMWLHSQELSSFDGMTVMSEVTLDMIKFLSDETGMKPETGLEALVSDMRSSFALRIQKKASCAKKRTREEITQYSEALATWFDDHEISAAQALIVAGIYIRAVIYDLATRYGKDPKEGLEAFCKDMKLTFERELQ